MSGLQRLLPIRGFRDCIRAPFSNDQMHIEILRPDQESVLKKLGRVADEDGFYLAGGTALALHFGHRRSDDFDWFTQAMIDDPQMLEMNIHQQGLTLTEQQISPGTL